MKFRAAKHTNSLTRMKQFYTEIIGLTVISEFKDHDGYDGVIMGGQNGNWQVEFTSDDSEVTHYDHKDDLHVFYCDSEEEFLKIRQAITTHQIQVIQAKNPYWNIHGITITDPDKSIMVIVPPSN